MYVTYVEDMSTDRSALRGMIARNFKRFLCKDISRAKGGNKEESHCVDWPKARLADKNGLKAGKRMSRKY